MLSVAICDFLESSCTSISDVTTIDEVEHLCAAADFLVELCDAVSSVRFSSLLLSVISFYIS